MMAEHQKAHAGTGVTIWLLDDAGLRPAPALRLASRCGCCHGNDSVPAPTLRIKVGTSSASRSTASANPPGPCPLDYFGCTNTTNLHTHGFHVSPKCGNNPAEPDTCSDSVLVDIEPGQMVV